MSTTLPLESEVCVPFRRYAQRAGVSPTSATRVERLRSDLIPERPAKSPCPDCAMPGAQHIMQACFGLALTLSLLLLFPTTRLTPIAKTVRLLLLLDRLERPPRAA